MRLVGHERLPAPLAAEVAKFPHMDWSFFSVHLAMTRLPEYRAASFDTDVSKAWVVNLGYVKPEAVQSGLERCSRRQVAGPKAERRNQLSL